jgi:hypothetical protein
MKRLTIAILLSIVMQASFGQQQNAAIAFEKTIHDYGTIKEDAGIAYYDFAFTNTGGSPLIVQRVTSTCGCTTPEWPKEPIAPGAKGKIRVGYDPKGRPGPIHKTMTVYSNAETPAVVLQITGKVQEREKTLEEIYTMPVGDLRFERGHLSFGKLLVNKTVTDTLKFMNFSDQPFRVGANTKGMDYLSVRFIPETVKPREVAMMVVTYNAGKRNDWGFVIDRISLTKNDVTIPNSFISISGSIEEDFSGLTEQQLANSPRIEFSQTAFDFGDIKEGVNAEYEFTFRNAGKSDLMIRKVKPSCGCTTVEPSQKVLKPGESSSIKASFRTNGYSGRQSKSITVITNDPKMSTVVLRLSGNVSKTAQ